MQPLIQQLNTKPKSIENEIAQQQQQHSKQNT